MPDIPEPVEINYGWRDEFGRPAMLTYRGSTDQTVEDLIVGAEKLFVKIESIRAGSFASTLDNG